MVELFRLGSRRMRRFQEFTKELIGHKIFGIRDTARKPFRLSQSICTHKIELKSPPGPKVFLLLLGWDGLTFVNRIIKRAYAIREPCGVGPEFFDACGRGELAPSVRRNVLMTTAKCAINVSWTQFSRGDACYSNLI